MSHTTTATTTTTTTHDDDEDDFDDDEDDDEYDDDDADGDDDDDDDGDDGDDDGCDDDGDDGDADEGINICSRNGHASLDIPHESTEMSTRAETFIIYRPFIDLRGLICDNVSGGGARHEPALERWSTPAQLPL